VKMDKMLLLNISGISYLRKEKKIFEDSLVHVGDHTVSSETISLFRSLLENVNWGKSIKENVLTAI